MLSAPLGRPDVTGHQVAGQQDDEGRGERDPRQTAQPIRAASSIEPWKYAALSRSRAGTVTSSDARSERSDGQVWRGVAEGLVLAEKGTNGPEQPDPEVFAGERPSCRVALPRRKLAGNEDAEMELVEQEVIGHGASGGG